MAKPPTIDLPDLDVPDLELPSTQSRRPPGSSSAPASAPSSFEGDGIGDPFGGGIVRGADAIGPTPRTTQHRAKALSVDLGVPGGDDDPFGGAIERGGGADIGPAMGRPAAPSPVALRAPASMNLELAHQRLAPAAPVYEPSKLEHLGGRALALVGVAVAVVPLMKYVHHAGAFSLVKRVPHAFDATSLVQSGVFAGIFLVTSIAIGYLGIRARPRSWAMCVSGLLLLIALLAMVTIALIATDEQPEPADAGRLIPYIVPAAVVLLGLGIAGRGQEPYLDGGARRLVPIALGIVGGLVVFAGIALSNY